jgi:superfamily II DNA or RNA helicase
MNIDDIADRSTNELSPGEKFREKWLDDLPTGQWPSYIDESAQLIADGIFIGETELTKADFGPETGSYYRKGLAASSNIDVGETSLPLGSHSAKDIGRVAWTFNRLREEIRQSQYTDFKNPSRAIEAAVNKSLVESIETGEINTDEIETIRLPESATVSTLLSEVFCRPRSETYVDLLLKTVRESATSGLLDHLDEPRMVTPMWNHQAEALDAWLANGCRGYVDMATATGKTVLGLAAVAHHLGRLHPNDRTLTEERHRPDEDQRSTVVVVAHRGLILDQWKREFDTHLNIPEQRATRSGEHTIEFEWGDVHFWTPNRLQEEGVPDSDLVVLDETHHYLGSSGFGSILDEIDGHVLALSGSLDEANARSLERRDIPKLFEFSLRDGQEAGVIPQCDWDVVFAPYGNQSQLADVTSRCRKGIERYAGGVDVPSGVDADGDDLSFETLSEARSLVQSTAGRELKESDPEFREFASALMARQMTQYNLSPALSTVTRLVLDHVDQHKCVVLLESSDEIEQVTEELESQLGEAYSSLVTVFDDETGLSAIEEFDKEQENGALVGIASTLGEGVDIETADVCINRGRGRLSRSLVQRMGRILRNPDGDKYAQFFHISGVPTRDDSILNAEDGVTLLETASQLLAWGEKFHARPVFDVDTETSMTKNELVKLEHAGADAIEEWTTDHYDWPSDDDVRDNLESLCTRLDESEGSALLSIERQERELPDSQEHTEEQEITEPATEEAIEFVAADSGTVEVAGWLYELAEAAADGQSVDTLVEESVRSYAQEAFSFPESSVISDMETEREVTLNPALDAVLSAYADTGSRDAAVHAAIAKDIKGDIEVLLDDIDSELSQEEIQNQMEEITHAS